MSTNELKEKYVASMVLGGVGDALGYNNGSWEFCRSGSRIHEELNELGGLAKLSVYKRSLSDDTIMHIATAEAIIYSLINTGKITRRFISYSC